MGSLYKVFEPKDPVEELDYLFDWAGEANNNGLSDYLDQDETIVDHEVIVPDGLTLVSTDVVNGGSAVLVWISGGAENNTYDIRCRIVTSADRVAIRTAQLPVKKR